MKYFCDSEVKYERDLNVMALCDPKLKGRSKEMFGRFKGMCAKEGVAIIVKDELWGER